MPDQERRNPYFILGVDYGASVSAATAAFGKKSRKVRRDPEAVFSVEDLTWALSQVEQAAADKEQGLGEYFYVPADPEPYEISATEGILLLPVQPLSRETGPFPEREVDALRATVEADAREALFVRAAAIAPALALDMFGIPANVAGTAPSMAKAVRARHEEASAALAGQIRQSIDPKEILALIETAGQAKFGLSKTLLLATASNHSTDADLLDRLARMPGQDPEVLAAIASNPACPVNLLRYLTVNAPNSVRKVVATNKSAPKDLRKLAKQLMKQNGESTSVDTKWVVLATVVLAAVFVVLFVLAGTSS